MKQSLLPHAGKVVSVTNCKVQSKGRSLVYFDRDLKIAFDKMTKVGLSEGEFPLALPLLPNVQDATLCNGPCMVSLEVVLLEDAVTNEAKIQGGGTKKVSNAKVASGDCSLNVAFWHPLSEDMATASKNGVYRLDWMMLIPEGPGKFKLTSGSGSVVQRIFGDEAEVVRGRLGVVENITSLSAVYGRSREEKLKEKFAGGSLTTLHHIMHLDPASGSYSGKSMMIPSVFVKDIRGMNNENADSLWYLGCTTCKKQLQESHCEVHGANAGKRVYGAQVLFADPTRTLEVAVWEDALKAMAVSMAPDNFNMEEPEQMCSLLAAVMTQKLCLRVEFGVNKAGTGTYYDVFDISPQVTEDGVAGAFKALASDVFFGTPGIVPACCENIRMNAHEQLQLHAPDKVHTVDSVHLFCQVVQKPQIQVMQDIDGIQIEMPCACSICGAHIKLVAAGMPASVQEFMLVQQKKWLNVLCQRRWPDGSFLVAQFKEEKNEAKLEMSKKLFKFECQQVISKVKFEFGVAETRTKSEKIEELLTQQRPAKRLKMEKTLQGEDL
eukprot:Skav211173  [mRNA]  locus=scaffold1363:250458:252107:- [translate_table: standard]